MKRTNSRIIRNSGNARARRRMASRHRASTAMCATPPAPPPAPRKTLCAMTPEEVRAWIQATRSDHRGIRTPTDDVYEQDHQLEDDLLALLDELEARR